MNEQVFKKELSTVRLSLRKFNMSDSNAIVKLLEEKEVAATTLMLPYPCSRDKAEKMITEYQQAENDRKTMRWAIILKSSYELIGGIRLVPNQAFNSAEIGFWIGKPFWKKGYGFEAAAEVIDFGFEKLSLNRLEAHAMLENTPSIELLQKLGFSKEGLHPELVIKWGEYKDVVTFGFLKKNYRNGLA